MSVKPQKYLKQEKVNPTIKEAKQWEKKMIKDTNRTHVVTNLKVVLFFDIFINNEN